MCYVLKGLEQMGTDNSQTIKKIWEEILLQIKNNFDPNIYNTFFLPTVPLKVENQNFIVETPTRFAKEILNAKFSHTINEILKQVTQTDFIFVAKEKSEITPISSTNEKKKEEKRNFKSNLNPLFTFENFVVGPSNRECYEASLAAAIDPGKFYNPLFIYGKSGIGKTHLLHAIGNYCRLNENKTINIYYTTANEFVDEFMRSTQNKDIDTLKEKFKSIDVLLLDDVQFLAGKDKTGEVFFHIFNTLFNEKKQIVLTSDRNPNDLRGLESRLVSRFASGLTVGMNAPEHETAYAILKRKIEVKNMSFKDIDDDVLNFIASNFSSDVRQLEGALTRLFFYSTTISKTEKIDLNLAMDAFKDMTPAKGNKTKLSAEQIKTVVADYYNLTVNQLTSKSRTNTLTIPRHIAIYLCRNMLDITLEEIGQEFGNRDHTTIMNACLKIENLCRNDDSYKLAINKIKKILTM